MNAQEYRQKFMETFNGKLNLSCYIWDGKISSFADPTVEHVYAGWQAGFIQGQQEKAQHISEVENERT